jgi:hypothetical protein
MEFSFCSNGLYWIASNQYCLRSLSKPHANSCGHLVLSHLFIGFFSQAGLGSAGSPSSGTGSGVVSGGSSDNPTPPSQGESSAHCDRPGYPSCYSLGSKAGAGAPVSSCPSGHSKAFCSAYNSAAGSSTTNTQPSSSNIILCC